MTDSIKIPNYGVDAPPVVRNLFVCGILALGAWALTVLGICPSFVAVPFFMGRTIFVSVTGSALLSGIILSITGFWMIWTSKVGKLGRREELLNRLAWSGHEQVLDVGCGRGLMLMGAAKRLSTGKAIGVDLWQAQDLSGNRREAALENARREKVLDRVEIHTMDMRKLSFPNESFDVVLSFNAVHNVYSSEGRETAISEIARVLKPGGMALIEDIRYHRAYTSTFAAHGCNEVQYIGSKFVAYFLFCITWGSLCPAALLIRKNR